MGDITDITDITDINIRKQQERVNNERNDRKKGRKRTKKTTKDLTSQTHENNKTRPIFTNIFELIWFILTTSKNKPLFLVLIPFCVILLIKFIFKKYELKLETQKLHLNYLSVSIFLFYEFSCGHTFFAFFRDSIFYFGLLFMSSVVVMVKKSETFKNILSKILFD